MLNNHNQSVPIGRRAAGRYGLLAAASLALLAGGCASPLAVQSERDLRRSVLDSVRRELAQAQQAPEPRVTQREEGLARLDLKPELMPTYERMAGPQSYDKNAFPMDNDLLGRPQKTVPLTLEKAIRMAAERNLQIQFARLQPAVAEAQVVAAQAAFDTTFFNNFEYDNLDQPQPQQTSGGIPSGATTNQRQTVSNSTGLRRNLTTGGQVTLQQDLNYTNVTTPGFGINPDPANEVGWTLRLDQPLLRGFGSDVTLAQVRINKNAERDAVASLKRDMIRVLTEAERDYWTLVQARYNLLIVQRLYERGVEVRNQIVTRFQTIRDVKAAQVADANARVERRRADVIRAQQAFRAASDALKAIVNDPSTPVGAEELLVPVDDALDAPITFALADVLTNAIRNRPEVQQAILSIDNTSIRQQVADNARLPRLDLRLQTRIAGLRDNFGNAYGDAAEGQFIDYLVGFQFEQPLGNRAAEAQYRQRRLERMQATVAYRNTIQQILLEVKQALRQVVTNYILIEQARVARYAETENLRALTVENMILQGLTIERLDLLFQRQESLAAAEQTEVQALSDYNTSLAQLYGAMGTALEHNNIEFKIPEADDPLADGGLKTKYNPVTPVAPKTPAIVPPDSPPSWPWRKEPPAK